MCQYRQHSFNCGHAVFYGSYTTVGGKNKPLLVVVFGLKGLMTRHHLLAMVHCLVHFMSWLLLYTLHDTVGLKDCVIDVQLRTSIFFFLQGHLVRFPHELGGESYTYRAGPLENIHRV